MDLIFQSTITQFAQTAKEEFASKRVECFTITRANGVRDGALIAKILSKKGVRSSLPIGQRLRHLILTWIRRQFAHQQRG